ncbi:MAG: hypothetical protein H7Y38_10310 [Armatimonadetes bacterium]|nr:hypothetical protein [Armatimonadota bacterium]
MSDDAADLLDILSGEREEPAPPQSQIEWHSKIAEAVNDPFPSSPRPASRAPMSGVAVIKTTAASLKTHKIGKGNGFAAEIAATVLPLAAPVSPPADGRTSPAGEKGGVPEASGEPGSPSLPEAETPLFSTPPVRKGMGEETDKPARAREQIEKQRAALKQKEAQISALERDAAQTKRDLATLRAELDAARTARTAAEAEATNLRRRAERDAKRAKEAAAAPEPKAQPVATSTPAAPQNSVAVPLEDALRRMLRRGKYDAVSDICKEAIAGGGIKNAPAMVRGVVYALYAAALYGINEADRAADQDSRAVVAFLDAGAVTEAIEAFTRLLHQPTLLRSTLADDATLLRRLVALADRDNRAVEMLAAFGRVRIISPQGFTLLLISLRNKLGKRGAEIAATLAATAKEQSTGAGGIGADETVILPGTALSAVSPRKLAEAAESDNAAFVLRVRDALAQMRLGDPKHAALADALLLAVGEISRIAVLPYTTAPGFTPRCAIVDASNVARHNADPLASDKVSRVASLLTMRDFLFQRGFFPVVLIADATLRFQVDSKAEYLSLLARNIVRETAPNTSADETLLKEARDRDATLVSNDRFADWDADAVRRVERFGFALTPTGVALLQQ